MVILKQTKKLRLILLSLLAAVLLVAAGAYTYISTNDATLTTDVETTDNSNNQSTDPSGTDDLDAISPVDSIKDSPAVEEPADTDEPTDTNPTASVEITSLNQNGNTLQIRTLIQAVDTGTCVLTLTKAGSTTVTRTASSQALSSSTTCQGFNIDVSELDKGLWQLDIEFDGNEYRGKTSQKVEIS